MLVLTHFSSIQTFQSKSIISRENTASQLTGTITASTDVSLGAVLFIIYEYITTLAWNKAKISYKFVV